MKIVQNRNQTRILKIWITKKTVGSSLAITIVIALIVGLMSSFLVLRAYSDRSFQLNYFLEEKLENNLMSGISICLADTSQYTNESVDYRDLFGNKDDSIMIKKYPWGIYQIGICKVWASNREKTREIFMGSNMPDCLKSCLYLVDHDRPLSLVGNAKLVGDAFLPKAGVRPSYINQISYNGEKMVYGEIFSSDAEPPSLNVSTIQYLNTLLNSPSEHQNAGNDFYSLIDSGKRKFIDSLHYFFQTGDMHISNISICGHIILQSDSIVEIESSASLQNVIVIAPVVRLQNGFRGRLQILASHSISVGDSCDLQYPSALILMKDEKKPNSQPGITVSKNCILEGGIYSFSTTKNDYKTRVDVKDSCSIDGILFVNGYLALESDVRGTVLTDYILHYSGASVYENYLVENKIDRTKLSKYYVGPSIFQKRKCNRIIQWLN
jgi:hypothetical protein